MGKAKTTLVFLGALAFGLMFTYTGFKEFTGSRKLKKEGVSTTANVVDGYSRRRRGFRRYYLTVEFTTQAGHEACEDVKVSNATYQAAKSGKSGSGKATWTGDCLRH
mgnify:CR=1 FL=1